MPPDIRSFFSGKVGQGAGSSQEQSAHKEAPVSLDSLFNTPYCYHSEKGNRLIATIDCFVITLRTVLPSSCLSVD